MLGGAVLALVTTLNALFIFGTKSLLAIIDDGLLPRSLGIVNARFGTAHRLLLLIWGVAMVGLASNFSLQTFASYAALGSILIFVPVLLAALALPKRLPERYTASRFRLSVPALYLCAIVGLIVSVFFSAVILVDLKSPVRIGFFLLFILSGATYYALRVRDVRRRGGDPVRRLPTEWTKS
jgi:APA family basic amino acid/polyamine antiporter